jgi:hypothetical protein
MAVHTVDTIALAAAGWRTSSYSSGHGGNCVEVAPIAGAAAVRDSKDRDGGTLLFSAHGWTSFLSATTTGTFDLD